MFTDRFHGGPADGETTPTDEDTLDADKLVHKASGTVYVRDTSRDTATERGWTFAPEMGSRGTPGITETMMFHRKDGLTLGQLREFIDAAKARGVSDDTPVSGLIRMNGRLKRVEIR